MSGQDRDGLIAQFQSITGLEDAERVQFFLEASNWNVDLAISSFFDEPDPPMGLEALEAPAINQAMQQSGSSDAASGNQKPETTAKGNSKKNKRCNAHFAKVYFHYHQS